VRLSAAEKDMESLFSLCLAGVSSVPDRIWAAWSLAPETLVPLLLVAALYCFGIARRRRRRAVRGERPWGEAALFMAGICLLIAAWVSPLCRMAATLASAHMLQHVIIVALAPPLLVLGAGPLVDLIGRQRLMAGSRLIRNGPVVTAALHGIMIWLWHVPALYQAALLSLPMHLAMYGSLLISGLAFWASIIALMCSRSHRIGLAVILLLITMMHTGLLGALLTFSRHVWYPIMSPGSLLWGLAPLEDQQLAGLIMWVPMGAIYLIAALAASALALRDASRHGLSRDLP